jgi:hypothetical protein
MNIEKTMKLVLHAWATAHSFDVDNLSVSFSYNGLLWHVTIDDMPDGAVSFPLIGGQVVTGDTVESALSELARRVWTDLTPKWECLDELREAVGR